MPAFQVICSYFCNGGATSATGLAFLGLFSISVLHSALRSYLAFFLLLCLTRTLLPEAWVLRLHAHEHTTSEPVFRTTTGQRTANKALLTPKHTHCQTEQFYSVPFQAASPVAVPSPPLQLSYRPLEVPTTLASSATVLRRTALRGPPLG